MGSIDLLEAGEEDNTEPEGGGCHSIVEGSYRLQWEAGARVAPSAAAGEGTS